MRSSFCRFLAALVFVLPIAPAARRTQADFRASATVDEIARRRESRVPTIAPPREIHEPEHLPRPQRSGQRQMRALPQPVIARANAPVSYSGFLALLDNFTAIPPDTTGAVGPQHVVTMLNTQVHIQSRTGVARANFPISLNAFWSPLGSFGDTFDPRIQYDPAADRWIACAAAGAASDSSALLVAVSQTGDPGGAWSYLRIKLGPTNWGDYPVLGFNGNWIVISINQFRVRNSSYQSTSLYVFNKGELYRGGTGAFLTFSDPNGELVPARDYDDRPDQMYFVQTFAGRTGAVRLSKLQGRPGAESFGPGSGGEVVVNEGWGDIGPDGGEDVAPQLGTSAKIDTGDSRIQNCVLRAGTIWCAHSVFLPYDAPTRAAIQWFQLDPSGPKVLQSGRLDDPSAGTFYAYPSIAVNKNGDMLLGFTRFSTTDYASAEFAFRLASDPPGALEPDVLFKRGEAPYINPGSRTGINRWGDYSATVVDPVDDLSFWTIQEFATTPPGGQRGQFGTWWAKVTAPSAGLRCTYSLSSTAQSATAGPTNSSISVTTDAGCPWMAASNAPWIQIASGTPGTGSGAIAFTIATNPNPVATRTGTITVAGQTVTITQGAPPAGVDLTVTGVTAPASAQAGQPIAISATVTNLSAAAASAFRIALYLGLGAPIAGRDPLLDSCPVATLAPGASTTCTRTVALPSTIQPGRYVIGAIADDQRQIADPNPANNTGLSNAGAITITSAALRPEVSAQGIVNAASYQAGPIAPGELITIFGTNLAPASPQFPTIDAQGNVGTSAGGTRVLFDGVAAPILYAIAGQVSAMVPFAVAGRSTTSAQVEYLGVRSDPIVVPVVEAAPAIFGNAILNQDLQVNTPENGAARGSTLVIYATGGGAVTGAVDGRIAQPPYAQLDPAPTVRIGGIPARVAFAGAAPGMVAGVLQINVVVPADAPTGGTVPIEFSIGQSTSQSGVTVAIR